MKINKNDLIAGGLYLGLTLLFFIPFLTGEQIFGFKDLSRYFYPLRHLMVEQVKAGLWPLWNPYIFCGYPLMATLQVGFFYPLSLIYYLLPFNLAFNYYLVGHYFLAACFMYFLLRHFRLSWSAAFAGGAIFAFSGYLLSVSNMNTSLSSVIWLPLIVLVFDRLLKQIIFWPIIGLTLLLATQFLGGEPTIIYVTLWFLVAYAFVFARDRLMALKGIGALVLSGLLALGLCAIQLIPFLELAQLSDRVVRTTYGLVTFRSLPPRELINFIFPYFFGNPAQFGGFTDVLIGRDFQDWLISPYLGILPLLLLFFAFARDQKRAWFFFGAALVGLLLAFGSYTPLYRLIYLIPGVALIRYPVKYLFLVTFALALLASLGFDRLWRAYSDDEIWLKQKALNLLPLLIGLASIFIGAYFFRNNLFNWLAQHYSARLPQYFFQLLASMIEFNLLSYFFIICYIFGFILVLLMAGRGRIKQTFFGSLLIVLILADLYANGATIAVPLSSAVVNKEPDNLRLLSQEKGLYRLFYTPELEKANQLIFGKNFNDAIYKAKDSLTANWPLLYHHFDFYGYESILPYNFYFYYTKCFEKLNLSNLSKYNVKYIGATKALKGSGLKLLSYKKDYLTPVYLYRNDNAKPRAYFLRGGNCSIVKYRPGEIVVQTLTKRPDRLFLVESYYPGWTVYIDGKVSRLLRADGLFCAVDLPAGQHRLRFAYEPLSFKIGALLSLLTIISLLLGGVWYAKKNK